MVEYKYWQREASDVALTTQWLDQEGINFMADYTLAHHNPEDRHQGDLEHVGDIAPRALLPVSKLRICAGCG